MSDAIIVEVTGKTVSETYEVTATVSIEGEKATVLNFKLKHLKEPVINVPVYGKNLILEASGEVLVQNGHIVGLGEPKANYFQLVDEEVRVDLEGQKEAAGRIVEASVCYGFTKGKMTYALCLETRTRIVKKALEEGKSYIESPIEGVFYRAPSPDAPPFIDVGEILKVGEPACIVEAMKVFNHINSDQLGRVIEVCAQDKDLVKQGQQLFIIEKLTDKEIVDLEEKERKRREEEERKRPSPDELLQKIISDMDSLEQEKIAAKN